MENNDRVGIDKRNLPERPDDNPPPAHVARSYNDHGLVRPWLVGTTKVYTGLGALLGSHSTLY